MKSDQDFKDYSNSNYTNWFPEAIVERINLLIINDGIVAVCDSYLKSWI